MEIVEINGKEYCLNIEKALDLGVLEKKYPYNGTKVKSWDEYVALKSYFGTNINWSNLSLYCPLKSAKQQAFEALGKLIQLHDTWCGEWEPDWEDFFTIKYCITAAGNEPSTEEYRLKQAILAFPTEEMRDEFYECFADLINTAKQYL